MKKEKDEYRIIEIHRKFYIERLEKLLWWSYYVEVMENEDKFISGNNIKYFDTLKDAKEYIENCKIKIHNV